MATQDEILDAISNMTVIELKELLDAFEEKFDVTAAAPAAVAVAAPAAGGDGDGDAGGGDEQTEFDVILTSAGPQKIQVVKAVKDLLGVGLKDAKDLVDAAPKPILENVNKTDAEAAKEKLEGVGAEVEMK